MDVERERIAYAFQDPLDRVEVPREVVYRPLLVVRHGPQDPVPALRAALEALPGARVRMRRLLATTWLRMDPPAVRVRVRNGEVTLRASHRLQHPALRRLVGALAQVPGAHALELHGEVPRFSKAMSGLRACSPCQARRL